mmetsp:Transcript_2579/g.5150  ORF Transcript_2579/g.5150 Transcript_2579/m.5150 type:complete len:338 (-) Transcript_2579:1316-2329(-)
MRSDGLDHNIRAHHPLIVHGEGSLVRWVLKEQRTHGRHTTHRGVVEEGVPVGQQRVTGHDHVSDLRGGRLAEGPRLPPLGVVVGVAAEEGGVGARLHPAHHQLGLSVTEETTHVSAGKGKTAEADGEEHGRCDLQVRPLGCVVARPHGAPTLRARVERARENEGAVRGGPLAATHDLALRRRALLVHAVKVVPLAVLDALQVLGVLGHGDLRSVEDRWLVHIVPRKEVKGRPNILVEGELLSPPLAHVGRGEVEVGARARPAPAVIVAALLVLDIEALVGRLLVDVVVVVAFEVRVDDGDHAPAVLGEGLLHSDRVWEHVLIPCEVSLAIRVLNVQP